MKKIIFSLKMGLMKNYRLRDSRIDEKLYFRGNGIDKKSFC